MFLRRIYKYFKEELEDLFSHRYNHPGFFYSTLFLAFAISFGVFAYGEWARPPHNFPVNTFIEIPQGSTLDEIADILKENNIIRSTRIFVSFALFYGHEANIQAGEYFLYDPQSALTLAKRVVEGDYGIEPEAIVVPEGANVYEIAELFGERYASFDPIEFLHKAQKYEGYLFPDTYFVYPNITAEKAIEILRSNFEKKIFDLTDDVEASERTLEEIVTMASIIEREAYKSVDRKKISSALWNRIEQGIPLQVDVTFKYINGKHTYNLTREDLREDNPYNTYVYKGLPPTPIANPSLDAILAALNPDDTDYLYFLADRSGNTYFSETYEEHLRKKRIYVD